MDFPTNLPKDGFTNTWGLEMSQLEFPDSFVKVEVEIHPFFDEETLEVTQRISVLHNPVQ